MTDKKFDCVALKNAIQAELREERQGRLDEEIERERREWLQRSDHPLALWWRSLQTVRRGR